jgi:hypothetical protein
MSGGRFYPALVQPVGCPQHNGQAEATLHWQCPVGSPRLCVCCKLLYCTSSAYGSPAMLRRSIANAGAGGAVTGLRAVRRGSELGSLWRDSELSEAFTSGATGRVMRFALAVVHPKITAFRSATRRLCRLRLLFAAVFRFVVYSFSGGSPRGISR